MRVLIVAVTARMLAQFAAADGYDVVAYDRFGDADLRAIADGGTAPTMDALVRACEDVRADAVVYGAGLENRPDLVERLARGRTLLGTPPERLARVRDPWALAAAGLLIPPSVISVPRGGTGMTLGEWVAKPVRGGGGRGVRVWDGGALRPGELLQRRIVGTPVSAVACGGALLGVTECLTTRGFAYAGNVTPPRVEDVGALRSQLTRAVAVAAREFGVRGAFGVDAVWDGSRAWVLEVNPRPTAALELFGDGLFDAHVHDRTIAPRDCARVKLVVYAPQEIVAPSPAWWPPEARDVPRAGETIAAGHPVCTLLGADVDTLRARGDALVGSLVVSSA